MMTGYGRGFGCGWDMMGGGVGWIVMVFFWLMLLAGIVLLVVWAVRSSHGGGHSSKSSALLASPGHDEAVAIAKKRLATGEITAEQYSEIMRTLGG